MKLQGGCYCGAVRFSVDGDPLLQAQCHCREYIMGGGPNFTILFAAEAFRYTGGKIQSFTRSDLDQPATREFCGKCGTHLVTRPANGLRAAVKVGCLDDPSVFNPSVAVFAIDNQPFHPIPEGLRQYEQAPSAKVATLNSAKQRQA